MIENYPISNIKIIFTLVASIILWVVSLIIDQLAATYFSAFIGTVISFFYLLKFFNGILNPFKFLSIASVSLFFATNISWIISGIFVSLYYKINTIKLTSYHLRILLALSIIELIMEFLLKLRIKF